jgi:glycine betaine/proline transport system ATP-binding protein
MFKIFGPEGGLREALDMAQNGKSRGEIKDATGCVLAVDDVSFNVEGAEIFVIMGLSGSGKSTLLRCVNRLIEPTAGEVEIDGDDVLAMDRKSLREWRKKKTAMVFQHFGLLEHRSVLGNVAFGLELAGVQQKARETLELVGLEQEADSMIGELSGGMQQRVGLARALATEAGILLMDEAFSALDPLIRTRMQSEFLELQKDMPKTILFITHDLGEALSLGDRIAIMKDGAVVQIGTPEEIILQPEDDYVASFVENVDRSRVLTVGTAAEERQPRISPQDSVHKALEVMEELDLPYAFVIEDDEIKGAVRLRDAEQEAKKDNPELSNILMPPGDEVRPEENLISILAKASGNLSPLPVVDENGDLVGAITKDKLLRAVAGEE